MATHNLASLHAGHGSALPADMPQACSLWRVAADLGYTQSMTMLAQCIRDGVVPGT